MIAWNTGSRVSSSLFFNMKKRVRVRDRAKASQRNLPTKGGVPSAGRRGAVYKHTLWKQPMSYPSMQTKVESALSARLRRVIKVSGRTEQRSY